MRGRIDTEGGYSEGSAGGGPDIHCTFRYVPSQRSPTRVLGHAVLGNN